MCANYIMCVVLRLYVMNVQSDKILNRIYLEKDIENNMHNYLYGEI